MTPIAGALRPMPTDTPGHQATNRARRPIPPTPPAGVLRPFAGIRGVAVPKPHPPGPCYQFDGQIDRRRRSRFVRPIAVLSIRRTAGVRTPREMGWLLGAGGVGLMVDGCEDG